MVLDTNYICLKNCDTRNIEVDPKLHVDKSKISIFKKGGKYTIYGELKGTKAIYDETLATHEYDAKFMGWVNREFINNNFIDEETFNIHVEVLDQLFSKYL